MNPFRVGQSSLEIIQDIVRYHGGILGLKFIQHDVYINWRQVHSNNDLKAKWLHDSFVHSAPKAQKYLSTKEILALRIDDLKSHDTHMVWSVISKVDCSDGNTRHLPMMNFHPEIEKPEPYIVQSLNYLFPHKAGVLVNSGRYSHYYGNFLLSEEEWRHFLSEFLMPCILVSPRYIGHRLHDGYSTLRLTSDDRFKPTIPTAALLIN